MQIGYCLHMGKKDFIMNNKPAGRISPDNSIVIEKVLMLINQGRGYDAMDEIGKLDITKDDPDYYFIRGLTGFVHLTMGAESNDDDIAFDSAHEASRCFHEAYDHGVILPGMEEAMEFSDNLVDGDFDAIDEKFGTDEYDPMERLSRTIMTSMPLISNDDASDEGDDFSAVIRIADDCDISIDDFREHLSDVRHQKIRKKKGIGAIRFTVSGVDCEIERLDAESPDDLRQLKKAIEEEEVLSDFDSAEDISQCRTVIRVSVHRGRDKQDGSLRGICFASLIDSIIANIEAESVEVFGYLYDASCLLSAFEDSPTPLLMMEMLPVPCIRKIKGGYAFETTGFRCYGLPELSGRISADDLYEAYDAADAVITEIMKYSVLFRYGIMPEGKFTHISGLSFTVKGLKDKHLEVHVR